MGVLVAKHVGAGAIGAAGRNNSDVVLLKMRVNVFSREGQVLDRGPPGDGTNLRDAVVRVAAGDAGVCSKEAGAEHACPGTVAHVRVGTVDRGAPVGIPVVVESTTTAPGRDQLLRTARIEHRVGGDPKSNL